MPTFLIATTNKSKLKEFSQILPASEYKLLTLKDISLIPDSFSIPETADTFKKNAILKAKGYGDKVNLPTIADDSGLVIDYLHGQPGVNTARFAANNYPRAFKKILEKLKSAPPDKRTASFICCLALYHPDKKTCQTFQGKVNGRISLKPKGVNGFGFDPIFIPINHKKTFAQMNARQKNKLSHRSLALKKLKSALRLKSTQSR